MAMRAIRAEARRSLGTRQLFNKPDGVAAARSLCESPLRLHAGGNQVCRLTRPPTNGCFGPQLALCQWLAGLNIATFDRLRLPRQRSFANIASTDAGSDGDRMFFVELFEFQTFGPLARGQRGPLKVPPNSICIQSSRLTRSESSHHPKSK